MEKNLKMCIYMCAYVYIKLNQLAIHLKLIQYCKSTIIQ